MLFLIGCNNNQRDVKFNIDNKVILNGNDLNFKFKDLECSGRWILKNNESGLLTQKNIEFSDTIKFNKGILKKLECNQELSCYKNICKTDKYEIELDPEIRDTPCDTIKETYKDDTVILYGDKTIILEKISHTIPHYDTELIYVDNGTVEGFVKQSVLNGTEEIYTFKPRYEDAYIAECLNEK